MATGGADPGEAERHLSECAVCLEVFVDPKVLPCDHSLCAGCVHQLTQGSRIECPLCKVVHDVSRIRPDFRLQQFLDALTEKQKKEVRGTDQPEGPIFSSCQSMAVLATLPLELVHAVSTTSCQSLYM